LVNGFGEARSEALRAKVGGPKESGDGVLEEEAASPSLPAGRSGECCKLPQPPKSFPAF